MGRKKSKRKAHKTIKRLQTLQTLFECPFCNHERSCDVKFDRKKQRAQIFCRICSETYETDVNCKDFHLKKIFSVEIYLFRFK
jgi:transcription elongation factor Elf1